MFMLASGSLSVDGVVQALSTCCQTVIASFEHL